MKKLVRSRKRQIIVVAKYAASHFLQAEVKVVNESLAAKAIKCIIFWKGIEGVGGMLMLAAIS